jgi:hypothetical protein
VTFRIARLEFGALAVAGLAAVYAIWLAVGLPPLPLGTHVGRSPIAAPTVVQLANGPLRGTQPTFHPPVTTPGKPGRLDVGTALSTRFAPLPARKRTLPATPAAPAGPAPPRQTVDDSVHLALAPAASLSTPPPPPTPLPTTVTVPAVTVPALPQTPPVPSLPQVPQAPSPPPVTPPLPSVP